MTLAVDASITMAWCFKDEASAPATRVLSQVVDSQAIVPSLWPLEVANALLIGERRGRLTHAETNDVLALLGSLPISIDEETPSRAFDAILALARQENLSSYDAAYLELALRQRLTLATLDSHLGEAAKNVGVHVLSL